MLDVSPAVARTEGAQESSPPTVMLAVHAGLGSGTAFGASSDVGLYSGVTLGGDVVYWKASLATYRWIGARGGYAMRDGNALVYPYVGVGEASGGADDPYALTDDVVAKTSWMGGLRVAYVNDLMLGLDFMVATIRVKEHVPYMTEPLEPPEEQTVADMLLLFTCGVEF